MATPASVVDLDFLEPMLNEQGLGTWPMGVIVSRQTNPKSD